MDYKVTILATFQCREQLIREANAIWRERAKEVAARIPASMRKFAEEHGWLKSEVEGRWKLPEFLESLVRNTLAGGCNVERVRGLLGVYGFDSFKALEAGLLELARAWEGLVRIEIDKEELSLTVRYYAAEVTLDQPKS